MPLIAAFSVAALSALAVRLDMTDPGLRAMVVSLVVFLPGTALTTAVLELAAGQTVSAGPGERGLRRIRQRVRGRAGDDAGGGLGVAPYR